MSLTWYARRLRAMSPRELVYRAAQSARRQVRRMGTREVPSPPRLLPAQAPALCIRFFDVELPYPTTNEPIQWSRDYKNGVTAPRIFYGGIDYRDATQVGDSKYTWELNRHQFLVPWALEYRETGREEVARGIVMLIQDWIRENPRHLGINWVSSLELGLRTLSWGIALDLCSASPAVAEGRGAIADSVSEQAEYVRGTLSLFSSANNHLMGELVGLIAAAAFFPEASGVKRHAEFARDRIVEEALRQNFSDGVNREGAVYYHHYTLEYILTSVALFERLGWTMPPSVMEHARRMVEFVDSMVDERGHPFEVGDADDGAVTGLNQGSGVGVYESLLWTGAALFQDAGFGAHAAAIAESRDAAPVPDPKTRYWFRDRVDGIPIDSEVRVRRRAFREGGYFFSTDGDFTLMFKAGPFGYPAIAAHSHCDQLSVGLRHGGDTMVLTDAGTYVYHTQERWRRYFRGTSAHNTVGVDEREQAEYGGPFLWTTHADGRLQTIEVGADAFEVVGHHDGYRRLNDPVEHERRVLYHENRGYRIVDRLRGLEPHQFDLFWNLEPDLELEPREGVPGGVVAWQVTRSGRPLLGLAIAAGELPEVRILRGDEAAPAGFQSRQYLVKRPCLQVRARLRAKSAGFDTFIVVKGPFGASDLAAAIREWNG